MLLYALNTAVGDPALLIRPANWLAPDLLSQRQPISLIRFKITWQRPFFTSLLRGGGAVGGWPVPGGRRRGRADPAGTSRRDRGHGAAVVPLRRSQPSPTAETTRSPSPCPGSGPPGRHRDMCRELCPSGPARCRRDPSPATCTSRRRGTGCPSGWDEPRPRHRPACAIPGLDSTGCVPAHFAGGSPRPRGHRRTAPAAGAATGEDEPRGRSSVPRRRSASVTAPSGRLSRQRLAPPTDRAYRKGVTVLEANWRRP